MVKLKDVSFSVLNEAARKYVSFLSENETLIVVSNFHVTHFCFTYSPILIKNRVMLKKLQIMLY